MPGKTPHAPCQPRTSRNLVKTAGNSGFILSPFKNFLSIFNVSNQKYQVFFKNISNLSKKNIFDSWCQAQTAVPVERCPVDS